MITAIVTWHADPGVDRQTLIERLKKSIPVYAGRPGLVRKYICLDPENDRGFGIYLWESRAAAEAFYEMARPIIREETGAEPQAALYETVVIVDNVTGETRVLD